MINIKVDISNTYKYLNDEEISKLKNEISIKYDSLLNKTGKGNEFTGWMTLPSEITSELIENINKNAACIGENNEILVVIGIGGSYLGSRAVIEALSSPFASLQIEKKYPLILYAGNNISEDYIAELLAILDNKDYAIAVISKSGTTLEPAVAFRILKEHLEKKYGSKGLSDRIIVITDKSRGALKKYADEQRFPTYIIPDDVGGRYSVLTPVGLLPIAAAGINIKKIICGAREMQDHLLAKENFEENPAMKYVFARNLLNRKGKTIEILSSFQPMLSFFIEWWKQLYGESEGKEGKGIFPAGMVFTTDLHSLGQYIQEGRRDIFETLISVDNSRNNIVVPFDENNIDGLNYIAGKNIEEINQKAEEGTIQAHLDGNVPVLKIEVPKLDEETLGQLIYFFEFSCALSGYVLDVNPFDQPGVEAYKKNMFKLLGKQ